MRKPAAHFDEWSYVEDDEIVYCVGRQVHNTKYEAIAAYKKSPNNKGQKISISGDVSYNRLMYHGLPEEAKLLQRLDTKTKKSIKKHLDYNDRVLYINPHLFNKLEDKFSSINTWLLSKLPKAIQFKKSLVIACSTLDKALISRATALLYGGAALGLVNRTNKRVDDIDLLVSCSSTELYKSVKQRQQSYTWTELDPDSKLSKRRLLLKAKRWSTSQIRLNNPYQLSIDLKIIRSSSSESLWMMMPQGYRATYFRSTLQVIDDSEVFCISPALVCKDENNNKRIILMMGYMYIGCAVKGDFIEVSGAELINSSVILVSQNAKHYVRPDLSNVPVH